MIAKTMMMKNSERYQLSTMFGSPETSLAIFLIEDLISINSKMQVPRLSTKMRADPNSLDASERQI